MSSFFGERQPNSPSLAWLQVLRALAAISVVFFHAKDAFNGYPVVQKILGQGFFGVDIFFCLSGYIMCLSCANKEATVGNGLNFVAKRLARIYSGYWPALLFTFFLSLAGVRSIEGDALHSILLTSPILEHNLLGTAWTLVYELRFYIAIGACYFFLKIKLSPKNLAIIGSVIVAYNLYYYAFSLDKVMSGRWPLRYAINAFFLEFMFGMYIYMLNKRVELRLEYCLFLIPVGILLLCAGAFDALFANYEFLRAGTYGLAAALVLCIFISLENEGVVQAPKWLVGIGDSSYSLYLIHPILLSVLFGAINGLPSRFLFYASFLIGVVLMVFASWLWYGLVEDPARRFSERLIDGFLPKPQG